MLDYNQSVYIRLAHRLYTEFQYFFSLKNVHIQFPNHLEYTFPNPVPEGRTDTLQFTFILVDHPTQLICIWIFICQHTKKKDITD